MKTVHFLGGLRDGEILDIPDHVDEIRVPFPAGAATTPSPCTHPPPNATAKAARSGSAANAHADMVITATQHFAVKFCDDCEHLLHTGKTCGYPNANMTGTCRCGEDT